MTRRKGLFALLMISVMVMCTTPLAGCSSGVFQTQTQNANVTIVLDYTPNTNHIGIYVAQAKGYFADKGLNVTIEQPPDSGADALVASGKAQFGISFQDWMATYLGSDEQLPVTAVAAITQHNTSSILSLKSSGITSPKDMTGKTYATMDVAIEQAILKSIVNSDGGNWNGVNIVSNNAVDEYQGLKQGMFDCVWSYDAWGVLMCKLKGEEVNAISIASLNSKFDYYTPVIIANDNYLENNESEAQAFLSAVREGYVFASKNPDEAANILCEADPSLDEELVRESARQLADVFVENGTWGVIDASRWSSFFQWVNANFLTQRQIEVYTGFTNKYLK